MFEKDGNELPNCSGYIGCPFSINSYGIYSSTLIPGSIAVHSFQRNMEVYSPVNSPATGYFESETSSGDLQGLNLAQHNQQPNSPLASENSIIDSMNRANRYSPEEKKERIQRYRSKRTLRNFNKKIKYECRKSLADKRPRVRGRFARKDKIEKVRCVEEDNGDWISFLDTVSANLMPNESYQQIWSYCNFDQD